jgi:hypothetical protein
MLGVPHNMNNSPPSIPNETAQPMFFAVSQLKLVVMSTVTFGIYDLYWFYRNWKLIKQRTSRDIMPFWRAFFAFFFCYSFFREVKGSAVARSVAVEFSPGLLAAVWIGVTLCWRLPDPYWLVDTLAVLALLPVQKVVNEVNASFAPNHTPNARFSAWNIAGIVFGGLLFVLAIIGTFFPE